MKTQPTPQLGAAMALVQLLQEHPELPRAYWHVGAGLDLLDGQLWGDSASFDTLRAYANVLGGSIRAGHDFERNGQTLRSHQLVTVWRDVAVELRVSLPLAASLERAA